MRTRVRIDGQWCDLAEDFTLPANMVWLSDKECGPEGDATTLAMRIRLPSSPANDSIIGLVEDAYAAYRFNSQSHQAVVEVDGVDIFFGEVSLVSTTITAGSVSEYELVIEQQQDNWRKRLQQKPLSQTALEFSATLDAEHIESSWQGEQSVRFLPVHYDQYIAPYDDKSLYPPQRVMTVEDYMPFISARALVRQIFAEVGYEVKSDFVDSDLFGRLYIEGCYEQSKASASRLDAIAGFCAGRKEDKSAQASALGRVHLTDTMITNSLGCIAQTASSSDGEGLYSNSNGLVVDAKRPYYQSPIATTMRFEYYLKYTTDYRILSRQRLKCFDGVYVESNCSTRFNVVNPFTDRRGSLNENQQYHCIVFNHTEGNSYRVVGLTTAGEQTLAEWNTRSTKITMPIGWSGDCRLDVVNAAGAYTEYVGDWAMYDGYVEDTGTTEVEITISTPPEQMTPSKQKYLDTMYIYGAEMGQKITLSKESRIRSVFSPTPSLGSALTAADIMHYDCSQREFIEALQQMFNLRIYANPKSRQVYIEPKESFFSGPQIDWSQRIVLSAPITATELAADHRQVLSLGYRTESDGAVGRFNRATEEKLGQWQVECQSSLAEQGVERRGNGLFCPTLSATGVYGSAPSAALLQIGDRDADTEGDTTMRIVRYEGLQPLPEGQKWGFPSYGQEYPLAAFHYAASLTEADGAAIIGDEVAAGPAESFTLCFEDRDGAEGLNRYYRDELATIGRRRNLSVALKISPEELHNILYGCGIAPSRHSLYRLGQGQKALYRLVEIESYDAQAGVARCLMERTERD